MSRPVVAPSDVSPSGVSRRGVIARLTHALPPCFSGRYQDRDSDPTALGATLWHLYHDRFQGDLDVMLYVLIDEHIGISLNLTEATASSHGCAWAYVFASAFGMEDRAASDGKAHGEDAKQRDASQEANQAESHPADATRPVGHRANGTIRHGTVRHDTMLVLSAFTQTGDKMIASSGTTNSPANDSLAVWLPVAVVDLNGAEPDWQAIATASPLTGGPSLVKTDPETEEASAATRAAPSDASTGGDLSSVDLSMVGPAAVEEAVERDHGQHGTFIVRLPHQAPHYVSLLIDRNGTRQVFCTCSSDEEGESPDCLHALAVLRYLERQHFVARQRQKRGLAYTGRRVGSAGQERVVVFVWEAGHPLPLDPRPSQQVRNHSPSGFEYGYAGSGPAQLALAMLLDFTGDAELAAVHYQAFKEKFIAPLRRDGTPWRIEGEEIAAFLTLRAGSSPAASHGTTPEQAEQSDGSSL